MTSPAIALQMNYLMFVPAAGCAFAFHLINRARLECIQCLVRFGNPEPPTRCIQEHAGDTWTDSSSVAVTHDQTLTDNSGESGAVLSVSAH